MSTQTKNLNLNNIPESLIRQARAAAASEGQPLYSWAIEAFEEKLNFDRARDPGNITERLRIAIEALAGGGGPQDPLETANIALAPLLVREFPDHVQEEYSALRTAWRNKEILNPEDALTRLLKIWNKIWGPTWLR